MKKSFKMIDSRTIGFAENRSPSQICRLFQWSKSTYRGLADQDSSVRSQIEHKGQSDVKSIIVTICLTFFYSYRCVEKGVEWKTSRIDIKKVWECLNPASCRVCLHWNLLTCTTVFFFIVRMIFLLIIEFIVWRKEKSFIMRFSSLDSLERRKKKFVIKLQFIDYLFNRWFNLDEFELKIRFDNQEKKENLLTIKSTSL